MTLSVRCAVVGNGRVGRALCAALPGVGGPFGRGFDGTDDSGQRYAAVVLAVPDGQIDVAAAAIEPGPMVGHCAGALGLDALAPHECFGVHPLMTVPVTGANFAGAGAAVAGSSPRAVDFAHELCAELGLRPVTIADRDRGAYHAAASIAANFLVTLEDAAEQLMLTAGGDRLLLGPLVRAALENWLAEGGPTALTGPIARGDEATVARQRAAVAERTPHLVGLFDEMAAATRALASRAHRAT